MSVAGNGRAKAEEGQRGFIGTFYPKSEQHRISRPQSDILAMLFSTVLNAQSLQNITPNLYFSLKKKSTWF